MVTAPHKMVGLERCWIREVPLYGDCTSQDGRIREMLD